MIARHLLHAIQLMNNKSLEGAERDKQKLNCKEMPSEDAVCLVELPNGAFMHITSVGYDGLNDKIVLKVVDQ